MKAALCKTLDGPGAITLVNLPPPAPGPDEILVRVTAVGLNFLDTLICYGKYQDRPPLPFSPGAEIAGVVETIGAQVAREEIPGISIGTRVCGFIGWGGAREFVSIAANRLVPIPDGVSDEIAAGISVTYGTAIHGLKDRGGLAAGQSVAVLGAAGGAGMAAIEIAKLLGGRIIAAASSDDKLKQCMAQGADEVINYAAEDLKRALRDLCGKQGVDVIYDCVGGDYAEPALRAIAWQGRYLVVGFAAGNIPRLPLNLILLKGCDIRGVYWGEAIKRDPAAHLANMRDVLAWIAKGELTPHIHRIYPLSQIGEAIGLLERRRAQGKVIIAI